mmetsp:Transcript_24127/g.44829  ORF Transcript_24127/g.44829 Transcript_24127/m.44829 type:complete len:248 (-) Transcript_24127:7508-8251(-)
MRRWPRSEARTAQNPCRAAIAQPARLGGAVVQCQKGLSAAKAKRTKTERDRTGWPQQGWPPPARQSVSLDHLDGIGLNLPNQYIAAFGHVTLAGDELGHIVIGLTGQAGAARSGDQQEFRAKDRLGRHENGWHIAQEAQVRAGLVRQPAPGAHGPRKALAITYLAGQLPAALGFHRDVRRVAFGGLQPVSPATQLQHKQIATLQHHARGACQLPVQRHRTAVHTGFAPGGHHETVAGFDPVIALGHV